MPHPHCDSAGALPVPSPLSKGQPEVCTPPLMGARRLLIAPAVEEELGPFTSLSFPNSLFPPSFCFTLPVFSGEYRALPFLRLIRLRLLSYSERDDVARIRVT